MFQASARRTSKGGPARWGYSRAMATAADSPMALLEARLLMHASHVLPDVDFDYPVMNADATTVAPTTSATATYPLSAIPVLNSRPGAADKLYLDFDGDTTSTWGTYRPGTTPAYDQYGDATSFSDAELDVDPADLQSHRQSTPPSTST